MRIALVAPPFIPVPPVAYGGTELFVAHLAEALNRLGHEAIVYANGESTVAAEVRWYYRRSTWPPVGGVSESLKEINHTAWAIHDAAASCDVIHLNNTHGLAYSRFVDSPFVCTIHHPHEAALSDFYCHYPEVNYVTIARHCQRLEPMRSLRTIHHGIDIARYTFSAGKPSYLCFLGRIVPEKGLHLAIEVARKSGIPLKIAGEVQPLFRDYFEREIKPRLDGRFVEFIGEADFKTKNELLGNSLALLFPIDWEEPFGLIMIEAMACGTPVLALSRGSVPEVVKDGVSGYISTSVKDMVRRVVDLGKLSRSSVRRYVEANFSVEKMATKYLELYSSVVKEPVPSRLPPLTELEHPMA